MCDQVRVTLQRATRVKVLPTRAQFARWVEAALAGRLNTAELTVRIVDEDEGAALNRRYRHKGHATNVLSFPAGLTEGLDLPWLGDLVLCAPVVRREARQQGKSLEAHWAHLVVHGTLHLLGYDHKVARQAKRMESLEVSILAKLGFQNPYTA